MNQYKYTQFKAPDEIEYNRLPWIDDFNRWHQCMVRGLKLSQCGYCNVDPEYDDPFKLSELRKLAKAMNYKLPIIYDPSKHFGYKIIPDYDDLHDISSECLEMELQIPNKPPYVPNTLRVLINSLENQCVNIEHLYCKYQLKNARAKRIIRELNNNMDDYEKLEELIRLESVDTIASAVLLFIKSLCPALLDTSANNNKGRLSINVTTTQHCSCFIMIHLLHVLEFSKDPVFTLLSLSEVFGPLMLLPYKKDDEELISKCIVEFQNILISHTYGFWYKLSQEPVKLLRLFHGLTASEKKLFKFKVKKNSSYG